STSPSNFPCTESYFSKYARWLTSSKSLMATTSTLSRRSDSRKTMRPMRPNPLIPIFTLVIFFSFKLNRHDIGNAKQFEIDFRIFFDGLFEWRQRNLVVRQSDHVI